MASETPSTSASLGSPKTDPKPLLDYLDKEGTVVGLLVAFCVGATAVLLERLAGAAPSTYLAQVWTIGRSYVFVAAALLMLGALMFYRQRSSLLWVLGLLAIDLARGDPLTDEIEIVDRWMFWWEYRVGWGAVSLAFVYIGLAFITPTWPTLATGRVPALTMALIPVVAIGYWMLRRDLLRRDKQE